MLPAEDGGDEPQFGDVQHIVFWISENDFKKKGPFRDQRVICSSLCQVPLSQVSAASAEDHRIFISSTTVTKQKEEEPMAHATANANRNHLKSRRT